MRQSRFTRNQMVERLREADKVPIADVAKKHGTSDKMIYVWQRRFAGMNTDDPKRLNSLAVENGS